jgi:1,4-dihydroxy-2-naphthoate octaprenyltransferase
MKALDWLRASQAVLFEASIVPAFVGTYAAISAGAMFNALWFGLILVSLIGIQAGANLFKGFYEGQDRSAPPSSPGSWLAFDSGAAASLARAPRTVLHVGYVAFGVGVLAGLVLVVLTENPILLAFGVAGAALAWSYSSPPLRLSYRGIGEISTFLAFGPVMTVGATVAFGGAGLTPSIAASIVLGFLAAAISFARYFPNREEDRSKGKRTPVTILGERRAAKVFDAVVLAPLPIGIAWLFVGGGIVWVIVLVLVAGPVLLAFHLGAKVTKWYGSAIGLTIAAHLLVGIALIVDFAFGL